MEENEVIDVRVVATEKNLLVEAKNTIILGVVGLLAVETTKCVLGAIAAKRKAIKEAKAQAVETA